MSVRYCEMLGIPEEQDLKYGMDFRLPQYRREVFLRFYQFHLKYRAHAGAIYYVFPYLFNKYNFTDEQRLWFAFINGCSQNVITTWLIFEQFPDINTLNVAQLSKWYREHYDKLGWDTDRRYEKNKFEECVIHYRNILQSQTQSEYFSRFLNGDPYANFNNLWQVVRETFLSFGRLATFSYLEYLKLAGVELDCPTLFLEDIQGSKSHRNGLCKVLGRDDMDWYRNDVKYSPEDINWLNKEAETLLNEAKQRYNHPDTSYFTLETTLCCYKSWHRKNRRYPNVYNDMFCERIRYAEKKWRKPKFDIFWQCRKDSLPRYLLLEYNPKDYGLNPLKQNHYLQTGEVIMMDKEWECFTNNYNEFIKCY